MGACDVVHIIGGMFMMGGCDVMHVGLAPVHLPSLGPPSLLPAHADIKVDGTGEQQPSREVDDGSDGATKALEVLQSEAEAAVAGLLAAGLPAPPPGSRAGQEDSSGAGGGDAGRAEMQAGGDDAGNLQSFAGSREGGHGQYLGGGRMVGQVEAAAQAADRQGGGEVEDYEGAQRQAHHATPDLAGTC